MQKKQKIILSILALFVVAAAIFFFTYNGKTVEEVPTLTATSTATTTVTNFEVKTESLVDSETAYELTIEYPQFADAQAGSVEERINTQFKKDAQAKFEQTSTDLKNASVGMEGRDIIFERKLLSDNTYINNETGIMSLSFTNYYDTGGAHGSFFYSSESVDIKTGNKIVLNDLLKEGYVTPLVDEIDRQIRTKAETCLKCDNLSAELDNLEVKIPDAFLVSDQGITFLFGAYELGSYAATASGQEIFVDKVFLNNYILRNW